MNKGRYRYSWRFRQWHHIVEAIGPTFVNLPKIVFENLRFKAKPINDCLHWVGQVTEAQTEAKCKKCDDMIPLPTKKCEHIWVTDGFGPTKCEKCGCAISY